MASRCFRRRLLQTQLCCGITGPRSSHVTCLFVETVCRFGGGAGIRPSDSQSSWWVPVIPSLVQGGTFSGPAPVGHTALPALCGPRFMNSL